MTASRKIDQMFKAFADETRLRILNLLVGRELCVCDLIDTLKVGQSKVSRHLAYLRHAGLVIDRRDGLWKYYALVNPQTKFHRGLIHCLRDCFSEVDVLRKDRKTLDHLKRKGRC